MKTITCLFLITLIIVSCERNNKCGDPNAINYFTNGVSTDSCHCKYKLFKTDETTSRIVAINNDTTVTIDTLITQVITILNIDSITGDTLSNSIDTTYTLDSSIVIKDGPIALFSFITQEQYTTSGECNEDKEDAIKSSNNFFQLKSTLKNISGRNLKISFSFSIDDNSSFEIFQT